MLQLITVIGLELYALLLAGAQHLIGVRTDEAKYLLNIPYPHPPLVRFFIGLTSAWPQQELFWRVILATLLVQGVWLVWSMGRTLPARSRLTLCFAWLCSGGVVLQAGTVMLAPLTALQGLVLVWLYLRRDIDVTRFGGWIAMFWGCSLFTAFQGVLYLPLMMGLLRRSRLPLWFRAFCMFAPIVLLALYAVGHPLIVASFVLVKGDNAGLNLTQKLGDMVLTWGIGGSIWLAVLGILGLIDRLGALFWTFVLLSVYCLLSYHDYYGILFLPLFIAGLAQLLRRRELHPVVVIGPLLLCTLLLVSSLFPRPGDNPAPRTLAAITARHQTGSILIAGSFGHEWQYASPFEIRRYRPEFLATAQAVICLQACTEVEKSKDWVPLGDGAPEIWVKP